MSAPTVSRDGFTYHDASNARIRKIGKIIGPATYTTGGDSLTPTALGLGKLDFLQLDAFSNGTVIIVGLYDYTAQKLKFFDMVGAEITNGTVLSAYSARFEAIGY